MPAVSSLPSRLTMDTRVLFALNTPAEVSELGKDLLALQAQPPMADEVDNREIKVSLTSDADKFSQRTYVVFDYEKQRFVDTRRYDVDQVAAMRPNNEEGDW
ncbi:hypothetical protein CMO91_00810 [Candidatus Woesearchaeota archaeon]|nr:hypothetical protein [Candidatus Woesearchaeota archaeon]